MLTLLEKPQAPLNALIGKLADAVDALADAMENGALEDKHDAAQLVEKLAGRLVVLTQPNGGEG